MNMEEPSRSTAVTAAWQDFKAALTGVVLLLLATVATAAQHGSDWPDWAYGLLEPETSQSRLAPPCADGTLPYDCAYIDAPVAEDGVKRSLPGSTRTFTRNEAYSDYGPADWYPGDHPTMPPIVARGRQDIKLRACALCHYPNGSGRMENGHVAGLPRQYILQQLQAFANGARRSADRRKANTNEMAMIAARLTETEREQAASYFAAIALRRIVRVVETTQVPQVRTTTNGLMLPIHDKPQVPLGMRIVVVPEDSQRNLMSRDPRGNWLAYVPVGSVAAGEKIVNGGDGRTLACTLCHGPQLKGLGDIPGIAGRTPSYAMRQLWDIKQGTRQSAVMKPIAENLSAAEMTSVSAYLASLEP
jgi:cytochrome c553